MHSKKMSSGAKGGKGKGKGKAYEDLMASPTRNHNFSTSSGDQRSGSKGLARKTAPNRMPVSPTLHQTQSKRRRFRPGQRALREIKKLQHGTEHLLARLPFQRLVREVAREHNSEIRFSSQALLACQEAAEVYLVSLFEDSYALTVHAKRFTMMPKDV